MKPKCLKLRALIKSEVGASSLEYGLLAAGVAATIAATVWALGGTVQKVFADYFAALQTH